VRHALYCGRSMKHIRSGSPYEGTIGFSRAVRTGERVLLSGTAPVPAPGLPLAEGAYEQMLRCGEIIRAALEQAGASLDHVVRTRMFVTHATDADAIGRAHRELFGTAAPAATMVVVAALLDPRWRVEVEAEAVLPVPARHDLARVARRWMDSLWRDRDVSAFDDLHTLDFADRSPAGRAPDRDSYRQSLRDFFVAFPDFTARVEDLVVDPEDSRVAVRWSATGTHRSDYLGIKPSHRAIRFAGIEILEVRGDRVSARWGEWDGQGLLAQLSSVLEK